MIFLTDDSNHLFPVHSSWLKTVAINSKDRFTSLLPEPNQINLVEFILGYHINKFDWL